MSPIVPLVGSGVVIRRVVALCVALCLIPPATVSRTPACAHAVDEAPLAACADGAEDAAYNATRAVLDQLLQTPLSAASRANRRACARAPGGEARVSSEQVDACAHDPPRTIRFCSLQI